MSEREKRERRKVDLYCLFAYYYRTLVSFDSPGKRRNMRFINLIGTQIYTRPYYIAQDALNSFAFGIEVFRKLSMVYNCGINA